MGPVARYRYENGEVVLDADGTLRFVVESLGPERHRSVEILHTDDYGPDTKHWVSLAHDRARYAAADRTRSVSSTSVGCSGMTDGSRSVLSFCYQPG